MNTITPNAARIIRREIRRAFAEIRADVAKVRKLRQSAHCLDLEQAEGMIMAAWWKHRHLQETIKGLRITQVKKFSNISPNGADRMAAFHATR